MEPNPPQKSKPKPDTRMLVGRRLQSRLRMEDQEEGESSTCSRDHGWKEKNQAQEDTRKGKRHLHSKKQMVQMTGRSLHVTSGTLGKHSLLTFHTYTRLHHHISTPRRGNNILTALVPSARSSSPNLWN